MNLFDFLKYRFLDNSVADYLLFAGILVTGLALKSLFSKQISRFLYVIFKRYGKDVGLQKFLQLMSRPVEVLITILIVYSGFDILVFPSDWNLVSKNQFGLRLIISELINISIILSLTWIVLRTIDFIALVLISRARKTVTMADDQLVVFVKEAVKLVIVFVGFFIILGVVFNLDIVSLVAGLGIGGLAIALAARESLENLLGSFTIFLDKPFTTGDSVRVGNVEGKVERVGFRSTRIRALDKMVVTVPNKKMIDVELINDTDRLSRRSVSTLSLSYDTPDENLKLIIENIREVLSKHPLIERETSTVRFRNFGSNGLEILIIFIVLTPEMSEFLQVQEEVNFQIMQIVKNNNSSFTTAAIVKSEHVENKIATTGYKKLSQGKVIR